MTGAELKALRIERGLTQEQLARAVGMTVNAIAKLEGNDRKLFNMKAGYMVRIAQVLGVDPAYLVGLEGKDGGMK